MAIRQLKSGNWNIRKMVDGRSYSITIDHKPTDREAERLIMRQIAEAGDRRPTGTSSFDTDAGAYISSVEGSLSESTIREYVRLHAYLQKHFARFCGLRIGDIGSQDVQKIVSEYSRGKDDNARRNITHRSAKSVSNMYGFIRSVMRSVLPDLALHVTLPDLQKVEPYIPTDDEVRAVCEALRGSRYEAAIILASLGCRRSEICALELSDVSDTSVRIHQAKVQDKEGRWVIKDHGKTATSTREIEIPEYLSELIRSQGFVYRGAPGQITVRLHSVQDRLGIPRFSVHKLRHFYASSAITLGVPLPFVQRSGGWATPATLQRIYVHAQKDKQREMDLVTMNQIASLTVPSGVPNRSKK